MRTFSSLLLVPLLLVACAAPPGTPTQPTTPTTPATPTVPTTDLRRLYQISFQLKEDGQQVIVTRSGPVQPDSATSGITAQASGINGLSFTSVSSAIFTHAATQKRYLSATFRVTNGSGTTVQRPTYLPVATSGAYATIGSTPFRNVRYFDGTDASVTASGLVIMQAQQINTANGLVMPDSNATPFHTALNTTGIQVSLPSGTNLVRLFDSGWVSSALPAGESQLVTFGVEVPKSTDAKKDPFAFDLLFSVFDGANTLNRWSDPATWGGTVPTSGNVTIPAGKSVLLDQDVTLNALTIEGNLTFADKDIHLTAGHIMLHGSLNIGTAAQPFTQKATITLNATDTAQNIMDMGTRGIMVMGGTLNLYGTPPSPTWTKLGANASAGASTLTLKDPVNWKAGDQVIVAPTDYYGGGDNGYPVTNPVITEKFTLSSAATGSSVPLNAGLLASRWGVLQYATDNGLSLTPGPLTQPSTASRDFGTVSVPSVLDERAEVGNLTRNIVIQGADDSLWQGQQFGAHVMIMGETSSANLVGVELRRMGQAGINGRYPIHMHLMSYGSSAQLLPDAQVQVRDSAIWNSAQRCIVIHGTNGSTVRNNICYDIRGHAVFLEDGVERRNTLENNLVLKVRSAVSGKELTFPEMQVPTTRVEANSSGFWITNPDNVIRGNNVADARSNGFWYAIPLTPLGLNANVNIHPLNLPFGVFEGNTAHSNGSRGLMFAWGPEDSSGAQFKTPAGDKYDPTIEGLPSRDTPVKGTQMSFTLKNNTYSKNTGGREIRAIFPQELGTVSADQQITPHYLGATTAGSALARSLTIGRSLNVSNSPLSYQINPINTPLNAALTYHSALDITQNIFIGFPFAEAPTKARTFNDGAGVINTSDYYERAVDLGQARNFDNRLIQSHPGRLVPERLEEGWARAGGIWDPHGYWGPKNNYLVQNQPFYTANANCVDVQPAGKTGKSCAGPYYGVESYSTEFNVDKVGFVSGIQVTRQDPNGNVLGERVVRQVTNCFLCNKRHFVARKGDRYVLRLTDLNNAALIPNWIKLDITNLHSANDWFVLGISLRGTTPIQNIDTHMQYFHYVTRAIDLPGSSVQAVQNDTTGRTYYQDKANNLLWVRVAGGMADRPGLNPSPTSDDQLYKTMTLRVNPPNP